MGKARTRKLARQHGGYGFYTDSEIAAGPSVQVLLFSRDMYLRACTTGGAEEDARKVAANPALTFAVSVEYTGSPHSREMHVADLPSAESILQMLALELTAYGVPHKWNAAGDEDVTDAIHRTLDWQESLVLGWKRSGAPRVGTVAEAAPDAARDLASLLELVHMAADARTTLALAVAVPGVH